MSIFHVGASSMGRAIKNPFQMVHQVWQAVPLLRGKHFLRCVRRKKYTIPDLRKNFPIGCFNVCAWVWQQAARLPKALRKSCAIRLWTASVSKRSLSCKFQRCCSLHADYVELVVGQHPSLQTLPCNLINMWHLVIFWNHSNELFFVLWHSYCWDFTDLNKYFFALHMTLWYCLQTKYYSRRLP